jgi:acetyl esterase/lipase
MVAALEPFGMADEIPEAPVDSSSPIEDVLAFAAAAEEGFDGLFVAMFSGLAPVDGVVRSVEVIKGVDGNDITLFVHRPTDMEGPIPGVLHLHGGGMVILEAAGPVYVRLRDELAATGLVVVGVEFRNAGGKHGPYPFPAGLDDCASALAWMGEEKAALGISKIVVAGESGGGNLTAATVLKAKRDGRLGLIDGAYAMCPYVSGTYVSPPAELASLVENDGYFINVSQLSALAKAYDPDEQHAMDPLAWPLNATADDLTGLPPHVISVNQLDPLRDEGLAYYRKLVGAGVSTVCRTVNGTCHGGDLMFRDAMPDVFAATMRDVHGFCASL